MTILEEFACPWASTGYRLELSDMERAELAALAEEVVQTSPGLIDDMGWLTRTRHLSCRLPVQLMEAVRRYRHDSGADGTLVLTGLPINEESLPDTPRVAESAERVASIPAAVQLLIGLQLGEVIAYREEKAGALVHNVVPVPGLENSQSNAGSDATLKFHVENAFHPHRPDFIGLICLREDHEKKAGTLVSSIRHALPLLDDIDRKVLHESRFLTAPPPSFHSGESFKAHPVLEGSWDDPNICVDFAATTALDDEAKVMLERLRLALLDVASSVVLKSGEMVFVDNRIVLHGRSRFEPRYDGHDRWLHRIYVHLDNRRSRSCRAGNGAVLT